jgi:hypothetical protein
VGGGEEAADSPDGRRLDVRPAAGVAEEDVVERGLRLLDGRDLDRLVVEHLDERGRAGADVVHVGDERLTLPAGLDARDRRAGGEQVAGATAVVVVGEREQQPALADLALQSAGAPMLTSRPWLRIAIRSQARSASSRDWVVRKIVIPSWLRMRR